MFRKILHFVKWRLLFLKPCCEVAEMVGGRAISVTLELFLFSAIKDWRICAELFVLKVARFRFEEMLTLSWTTLQMTSRLRCSKVFVGDVKAEGVTSSLQGSGVFVGYVQRMVCF